MQLMSQVFCNVSLSCVDLDLDLNLGPWLVIRKTSRGIIWVWDVGGGRCVWCVCEREGGEGGGIPYTPMQVSLNVTLLVKELGLYGGNLPPPQYRPRLVPKCAQGDEF